MPQIHMSANRRRVLAGAAATVATFAAPTSYALKAGTLKVGVLLPLSGLQAGIGQDCHRAVDVTPPILKSLGLPELMIMSGDTESNVETARARAEKLIGEGAQLLVGAFDFGHTTAIAQVAEQKGIPLVINIAAAPAITEQGYKFVFRNFPTAPMIVGNVLATRRRSSPSPAPRRRQWCSCTSMTPTAPQWRRASARWCQIRHAIYDRG